MSASATKKHNGSSVDVRLKVGALVALGAGVLWACGSSGGVPPDDGGGGDGSGDGAWGGDDHSNPFVDGGGSDDSGPGGSLLDVSLDGLYGPDGTVVDPDSGQVDGGCSPNGISCVGQNPVFAVTCSNGASSSVNCTAQNKLCADGFGCVACIPGSGSCNGSVATRCLPDGSGTVVETCDSLMGLTCQAGVCTGACANIGQSYIGCDYYAVTMLNHLLNQGVFFFSVSISNTSQQTAIVTITGPGTNLTYNIAQGAIKEVTLPWVKPLACGVGPCNGGWWQPTPPTTTRANASAYRIRSTAPITVYQFNARDYQIGGNYSYTNDASLLLPVNAMTGSYYVATAPSFYQWPGLIAIVATQANTQVTLKPSVNIVAGGGMAANGGTITMNQGDVLQVTNPVPGGVSYGTDMTGSVVTATAPVEVFGGHACIYIPPSYGYCDHIEEVMFPLETLRNDYVVVPPNNTNGTPKHFVRIVGTVANTALTYQPAVGGAPATLNAGQVGLFETTQAFRVTALSNNVAAPILVGTYMEGETRFTTSNTAGDPAMSAAVATPQYRKQYAFTAPPNYMQNWVTVTALTNTAVTIDGVPVGALTAIGASGYGYRHVPLCANNSCTGTHSATSAGPFGIQVYGYGSYTSYMYPGGLDLKR